MMSRKPLADLALAIAAHQANLARLGEAWGQRIVDQLDDSDRAIIARLRDLLREVQENYRINSGKSLQQLEYIRRKVEEIRVKAFVKAEKALRAEAESLIDNETKWSRKILAELSGEKASRFADLTPKQITRVLDNGVIGNRPWADWWTYTADADVQRIANVVNAGLVQGFTTEKIVQNIMGTRAGNYADGVLSTSRNSARRLARTMCSGLANQAKDEFYRQNDDLITAVEWLSTLDGRACPECAGLDRVRWKPDERHPVPPLHPSCRCVLLPVTELTDLGAGAARPMANADFDAEARRAYEEKYPGKKYDDLSAATRKKYYHQAIHAFEDRTGKPAFSRAPGSMSFREYFGRMSDRQKRDWLGPELYARWKAGKFSIRDYIPAFPDRSFTVKQLKELDKAAFASAPGSAPVPKTETPEEHRAKRQEQRDNAYDKRRDQWYHSIINAGVDSKTAGKLADLYSPEVARLGKPPKVVLGVGIPYYDNGQKTLVLSSMPEYQKDHVLRHEFAHWMHYQLQRRYPGIRKELENAAAADFAQLKKEYSTRREDYNATIDSARKKASKALFKKDWFSLSEDEKNTVLNFFDSVGSISDGQFGGLHGKTKKTKADRLENIEYFSAQNNDPQRICFGEVIAELAEEEFDPNGKLRLVFPNIYAIFQAYWRK